MKAKTQPKPRQCVCCGYNATKGSKYNNRFVCSACESEIFASEETRYEDEDWFMMNQMEQHGVRVF